MIFKFLWIKKLLKRIESKANLNLKSIFYKIQIIIRLQF